MKGLAALLTGLLIWTAGLLTFADRVTRLTPADTPAAADGIVALTGGSDLRLAAATNLLQSGLGQRLLVSGVNLQARRSDLWGVTGAAKPVFDCCVDLGYAAADTIGNAREAAEWTRAMGFSSLILVTADYHMPRAMLELNAVLPGVRITAYPVATAELDVRHWRATSQGARRMIVEYDKFLAALASEWFIGLGGPDKTATSA